VRVVGRKKVKNQKGPSERNIGRSFWHIKGHDKRAENDLLSQKNESSYHNYNEADDQNN
jgi:hypothetical protein